VDTKEYTIEVTDPYDEGMEVFARMVDPLYLNQLVKTIKSTSEKRPLDQLIGDFLDGEL
jgi:hypothetical protein